MVEEDNNGYGIFFSLKKRTLLFCKEYVFVCVFRSVLTFEGLKFDFTVCSKLYDRYF